MNSAQEYREATESHLGGAKVEAAGVFQREGQGIEWVDPVVFWPFHFFERLFDRLTKGRVGHLPGRFLAVTKDEVYAFRAWDWRSNTPTLNQIAVFDRDEIDFDVHLAKRTPWSISPRPSAAEPSRLPWTPNPLNRTQLQPR